MEERNLLRSENSTGVCSVSEYCRSISRGHYIVLSNFSETFPYVYLFICVCAQRCCQAGGGCQTLRSCAPWWGPSTAGEPERRACTDRCTNTWSSSHRSAPSTETVSTNSDPNTGGRSLSWLAGRSLTYPIFSNPHSLYRVDFSQQIPMNKVALILCQ